MADSFNLGSAHGEIVISTDGAAFEAGARPNLLHIPPVLPPNLKHRIRKLPKRAILTSLHQHSEHVLILDLAQRAVRCHGVSGWKVA